MRVLLSRHSGERSDSRIKLDAGQASMTEGSV